MTMVPPEKRRRITAAAIPADLLLSEILARPPAKSLGRCRCVCRSWRAAIAAAAFVRRHLELSRAGAPSVLSIPRGTEDPFDDRATSEEISFHRLLLPPPPPGRALPDIVHAELLLEKVWRPEGITCLIFPAHLDGLVAIATATDRVFVCNPATGEFAALPLGSHNAEVDHCESLVPRVAIGFDQWRHRYVVARYFYRKYGEVSKDHDVGHEVLTLGGGGDGGGTWELTQDPPYPVGVQRPICTRRGVYWHADEPRPRLMRFGLQHREFAVVPRPPSGWNPLDDMAAGLDGKLLFYVHATAEASFQVWLADDDVGGSELEWSLRCRVDLPDPFRNNNVSYSFMPVIVDGDTLVAFAGGVVWKYNVRDESLEQVVDMHDVVYGRKDGSKYYTTPSIECQRYIVPRVWSRLQAPCNNVIIS